MDTQLLNEVETQRLELEANVAKLRNALKHWQTLELDYEGLKEEFLAVNDNVSRDQCMQIARGFEFHKLDEKELQELIEPTKGKVRSPSRIADVLSKRVEYVGRNISSLRDQIAGAEKRRNKVLLARAAEKESHHHEESELPITEIVEELDDAGNVISSTLQPQGDSATKALGILHQAQIDSEDSVSRSNRPVIDSSPSDELKAGPPTEAPTKDAIETSDDSDDESISSEIISTGATKAAPYQPTNPNDTDEEAQLRQEMLQYGIDEVGNIVAELELTEGDKGNYDEDEDMDMDEFSDFDDENFSDEDEDEDEAEDEDGQARGSMHSQKYKDRMTKLQEELGLSMQNVGPSPDLPADVKTQIEHLTGSELQNYLDSLAPGLQKQVNSPRPDPKEAARKAAIARDEAAKISRRQEASANETDQPSQKARKKVAFAPDLDIAPEPKQKPVSQHSDDAMSERPAPTSETVIERASSHPETEPPTLLPGSPAAATTRKPSRFKKSLRKPSSPVLPALHPSSSNAKSTPTGPTGTIMSPMLIERPSTPRPSAPDPDTADFDTDLQDRQIALEHHRLRNRLIHEQGGYVQGGELENWGDARVAPETIDPVTGETKRISRFKAARLRG